MHSSNNTSTTPPCMFYSHHGPLSGTQDGRWMLLLEFLSVASVLTFFIGAIEFYCAQVPYKMKGLVIGMFYLLRSRCFHCGFPSTITTIHNSDIIMGKWYSELWILVFNYKNGVCSGCDHNCCFGDRCYKMRKREDLLPNILFKKYLIYLECAYKIH